ncbi:MAG: ATP-dependent zinc metalloprotease FtsH [Lachnospiraceae bacterium]|nr:ATP-dependent zinc metalloprotease FtsH [Lachnospiraceae bacterium]
MNKKEENGQRKIPSWLIVILVFFLITFVMNFVMALNSSTSSLQITYDQFLNLVEAGDVEYVYMDDTQLQIILKEGITTSDLVEALNGEELPEGIADEEAIQYQTLILYTGRIDDTELVSLLREYDVHFSQEIPQQTSVLTSIASWVLPIVIMYLIYFLIMRMVMKRMGGGEGNGMFSGMMGGGIGKSKAKVYNVEERTGVTFADVAGQDEAKESLEEMVDYLKNPDKYQQIGAKQPKGALLVGSPGTGKTLLAKAVAGEAGVPFYHLTGSEFVELYVGVGASRVRDLFETAKKNTPCIIFIDEIDAIGKKRDSGLGSNDEREQTLNQLLAEMDGFETNSGIIVLAATNRPEVLDQALLRAGRFDRRVIVDKPDLPGRENILKVHGRKVALSDDVDFHAIALATSGASGADLANIVNEAALLAVKLGRHMVMQKDLMEAVETVFAGKEKKDRVLNPKERRMVAYHEVGHALISALQKDAQPVQKITIVPRTMGSLGYTMNVPEEERYLLTKEEIQAQITMLLGGRAAEIVKFGTATTGASNDIERATDLARKMVTQYGMSDHFGSMGLEKMQDQYLDGRNVSTCSSQTGAEADEEVRRLIDSCQQEAIRLLQENSDAFERITARLLEKENISGEEFMELLREAQSPTAVLSPVGDECLKLKK